MIPAMPTYPERWRMQLFLGFAIIAIVVQLGCEFWLHRQANLPHEAAHVADK